MIAMRNGSSKLPMVALLAAALLAPLLIYFDTARSIVTIWNSSETFAHGYIILPISLWLIWKRREVLKQRRFAPFWPALLLLAACGFVWLLAELAEVQVVRQYALVAMIPIAVIALLGLSISRSLAFPLLFLMLAVPFGEIFINPLINFTADFTVAALQSTGIPVLRDGTQFSIPSGDWSVVEACSGVRYLIASFTLGCLYAYLTYRSPVRRAVFIALSILVPIVANGIRAYMIVMIGHLIGMEHAVGVDHLIYGWMFFGLVMFVMYWIGSFWREDQNESHPAVTAAASESHEIHASGRVLAATLSVVICMAVWPTFAKHIQQSGFNPLSPELAGFQGRWHEAAPFTQWKPNFFPPKTEFTRSFEHNGMKAGVTVLYYRNQNQASRLISSENRLVESKAGSMWRSSGTSAIRERIADRQLALRESRIQGPSGPLLVWHWYWIDGRLLTNDYIGKLLQAKEKILMKGDDGAAIFAFAPYVEDPHEARKVLRDFLVDHLAPLELTLSENTRNGGKRDD
jgi:exosortase A